MCGIHGLYTGNVKVSNSSAFISDGFVAGSIRGMDSSGIAVVDTKSDKLETSKLPVPGSVFITDKFSKSLIQLGQDAHTMTICHTRHATAGSVGYSNAHPFYIDDLVGNEYREMVGVHNGTLTSWRSKKNASKYEVDSEWALNHIFMNGIEAFKDFDGAFVFAWWDSENKDTLNIALNDQRPMHIAYLENGGMAYASEAGMLHWLLERNSLKYKEKLLKLSPGHLYKFVKNKLATPQKIELPKYSVPAVTYNYQGSGRVVHTTVQQMDALVKKVREAAEAGAQQQQEEENETTLPIPLIPDIGEGTPYVKREEIQAAFDLGMLNSNGTFIPDRVEGDDLVGTYCEGGMECDAIMRWSKSLTFKSDSVFQVTCSGVIDDGKDLIVVVAKPRIRLVA